MEESLARISKPAQRRQGSGFLVHERSAASKDALEKYRIKQRRECHSRVEPPKHPLEQFDQERNPIAADDCEVYKTGAVEKLHEQERERVQHHQDLIRSRRWQTLSRDHTYQQSEDAALVRQQNHNKGLRSRRIQLTNKGGTDYNILNFQYEKTAGGHALQTRDQTVQARAAIRTGRFYAHGHCVSHDIITGQPLALPCTVPEQFRVRGPCDE